MDKHHITIIFDKTRNIEDKEKADMVERINVADCGDIFRAYFYYHVLIKDKIAVRCYLIVILFIYFYILSGKTKEIINRCLYTFLFIFLKGMELYLCFPIRIHLSIYYSMFTFCVSINFVHISWIYFAPTTATRSATSLLVTRRL